MTIGVTKSTLTITAPSGKEDGGVGVDDEHLTLR